MKSIRKKALKPVLFTCLGLVISVIVFASVLFSAPTVRLNGFSIERSNNKIDGVTLNCEVTNDGGKSVTHFMGQYLLNGVWSRGTISDPKWYNNNKCDFFFLNTFSKGSEVKFRVGAVNEVGLGEFIVLDHIIVF